MPPRVLLVHGHHGILVAQAAFEQLTSVAGVEMLALPQAGLGSQDIAAFRERLLGQDRVVYVVHPDDAGQVGVVGFAWCVGVGAIGRDRCLILGPTQLAEVIKDELPAANWDGFEWTHGAKTPTSITAVAKDIAASCARLTQVLAREAKGADVALPGGGVLALPGVFRGGPCHVYHGFQFSDYCLYARIACGAARQLVTVLAIEPSILVSRIHGGPEAIAAKDMQRFINAADNQNTHYAEFRRHEKGCRIVICDDDAWVRRNIDALIPLKWLNDPLPCYVVHRQQLLRAEHRMFLMEHTIFDDHVCIYDDASRTLVVLHIDDLMSDPRFVYRDLWNQSGLSDMFVPLDKFLSNHGIDPRLPPFQNTVSKG
jgi:hypothetical protein